MWLTFKLPIFIDGAQMCVQMYINKTDLTPVTKGNNSNHEDFVFFIYNEKK